MLIFGNDKKMRGCYHEIMGRYGHTTSVRLTLAGGDIPKSPTDPYFISSIGFSQVDSYNVVRCFGGRNYIYAFGHDPMSSLLEVTMTTLLVNKAGTSSGGSLETLKQNYAESRISKNPKPVVLTVGSFSMRGFLVGIKSNTQDPQHNIQSTTFIILLAEPQG